MKNSFDITHTHPILLFLIAVICHSNFAVFRELGSNHVNLGKFKSRPWKENEAWTKCKNSVSFNLTYKITMDFIQGCIIIFKRLLIPEVIL